MWGSAAAYTTVSGAVRATLRESGWRGPFQGLGITIIRNVPANSVYLGSFEVMKRMAAEKYNCTVPVRTPFYLLLFVSLPTPTCFL